MQLKPQQYFYLTLDIFFMVFIVLTNAGIIGIIIKSKKYSKNILFVSLAIADLCIGLFVIPNVITLRFTDTSISGVLCISCYYFEYLSNSASVFTLSAIALGRFRALVFPLKFRDRVNQFVYGSFIVVWILSVLYGFRAPLVLKSEYRNITNGNQTTIKQTCNIPSSLIDLHSSLVILDFIIIFLVPSLLLTVCNVAAIFNLTSNGDKSSNTESIRRKKKAIRLLFIMIVIFVVCHFPLYFFRMKKSVLKEKIQHQADVFDISLILTFLNSVLNVFFYGSLNTEVKNFLNMARHCSCFRTGEGHGSQVAPSGTSMRKN